ncbi:MAG: hypothetical protein U0941_05755 [Planctomycetaceae bacterium]
MSRRNTGWEGEAPAEPLSRCAPTPKAAQQELRPPVHQPPAFVFNKTLDAAA